MKLARDTWLVYQRHLSLMLRNRTWLTFGLAYPVTYLVMFAPMLAVALRPAGVTGQSEAYLVYVPGLLVLMCLFGGLFAGFHLLAELRAGIIERSRVTPVSRAALLLGRALREVTVLLVQATIITVLALPLGLRVAPAHVMVAFVLLALVALATTTVSYYVALIIRNEGSFGPVMNTVVHPVLLLAGAFLPVALAPLWIQRLSEFNPLAWATHAMRALYRGDLGDSVVWQGFTIIVALTLVTVVWSARRFARTIR